MIIGVKKMNNILEQVQQLLSRPTYEEKRKIAEAYRKYYEEYNKEMILISILSKLMN